VSFTIEKLPGEPIIMVAITDPFDYQRGPSAIFDKVGQEIGNFPGSLYWITDLTRLSLNFRNWITMRAAAYISHPHSVESGRMHPLYVSNRGLICGGVALENMRRAKFDLPLIRLFSTLEEALEYARQNISLL
jgi:hypothetical protein